MLIIDEKSLYLKIKCEPKSMKLDITQIHSYLTKKELKKFGDYIRSPFFNTESRFIRLFELIERERGNITRSIIAEDIFGKNASTGDLRFRKLVSEFMKHFSHFAALTEYENSELTKRKMSLQWFRRKKDIDGYLKLAVDTDSYIKDTLEKDEEYYLELTILFSKIYEFRDSDLGDITNDFSFVINDHLDKYFISLKLFLFQRMYSLVYSSNFEPSGSLTFEKNIYQYIETHRKELKQEHPEIYLRYLAIQLDNRGFVQELYDEYVQVLQGTESYLKINENGLLLTLLNIISKFINSGRSDLNPKVLEIAELLCTKNLTAAKGINYIDLKIIIEAAIGLKSYDWAAAYMIKVKDHIKHENPANAYELLSSKVFFFKGDLRKARQLLSGISIDDYVFYCEAKLIECRINYLEQDFESVIQISETVKKYLKSHKNIGSHYSNAYKIFSDFIKQLSELQLKAGDKNEFDFRVKLLGKEMDSLTSPCYAYGWLKEQLQKLKAG
jgi:hypothetical protein